MSDISRSTYQKVCEENKRLKADIEILISHPAIDPDKFLQRSTVFKKWSDFFRKQKQEHALIKMAAMKYLKDHPEIKIPKI